MSAALIGRHFWHAVVFGGWGLAVAVVLIWPTKSDEVKENPALLETERRTARSCAWVQAAFLGAITAATFHLAVMPNHFKESWLYGAFFLIAASCQVAFACLLLVRPTKKVLVAGIAGSLAIVVFWFVSRFVGVPIGPDNGGTEAVGALDVLSTLAEVVTAGACVIALATDRVRPAWRWSLWSLSMRLALLFTALGAPVVAAVSNRG
jgi:hypothetical protein